jgi:hypothetical protein
VIFFHRRFLSCVRRAIDRLPWRAPPLRPLAMRLDRGGADQKLYGWPVSRGEHVEQDASRTVECG